MLSLMTESFCRSSSISGEFWWLRFKPIRTLGSARLWGPWRAPRPLPPAPHPRPRPLRRKALPRPSSFALPRPCRMHTRAEEHKLKKQEAQKCSIPFSVGGNRKLPGPQIAQNCGKNQAEDWMNHLPEFEGNMNLLHFSGSEQTGRRSSVLEPGLVSSLHLVARWRYCSNIVWSFLVSCVVITVIRLILSAETAHTCSDKGILHTSEIIRSLYFFILM